MSKVCIRHNVSYETNSWKEWGSCPCMHAVWAGRYEMYHGRHLGHQLHQQQIVAGSLCGWIIPQAGSVCPLARPLGGHPAFHEYNGHVAFFTIPDDEPWCTDTQGEKPIPGAYTLGPTWASATMTHSWSTLSEVHNLAVWYSRNERNSPYYVTRKCVRSI